MNDRFVAMTPRFVSRATVALSLTPVGRVACTDSTVRVPIVRVGSSFFPLSIPGIASLNCTTCRIYVGLIHNVVTFRRTTQNRPASADQYGVHTRTHAARCNSIAACTCGPGLPVSALLGYGTAQSAARLPNFHLFAALQHGLRTPPQRSLRP